MNPVIRAWSQGSVGDKTFQQITEQFADLIISKVWEREGRKVSRGATRPSISSKKVCRILSRVGPRKTSPEQSESWSAPPGKVNGSAETSALATPTSDDKPGHDHRSLVQGLLPAK